MGENAMSYDLLIHNAWVLTVNRAFDVIEKGMVGISGDTIALVANVPCDGTLPEAAHYLDAEGGILLPGLVNTHTHLPMILFRGLADDLPLHTWLYEHIFPAEAEFISAETVRAGALLACAEMLLSGTTTCCDGYFYEDAVAEAVMASGMRGVLGYAVIDFSTPGVPDPAENVRKAIAFAKGLRGNSPLITPSIFCHSPYACGEKTLRDAKAACRDLGVLFQIHVAETRKERDQILAEQGLSPVAYLDKLGILDEGTLLVHAVWTDEEDRNLIARSGAAISVTTESEMKLASGVAPVPEYLALDIPLGLGTDGAASSNSLDLFREMDMTAKLHKGRLLSPTVMDARAVITLATRGGAEAIGLGDKIGSIEKGKQADLILLDGKKPHLIPLHSPVSQVVYAAKGSDVRDVWVAGRKVVEKGRLLTLSLSTILSDAAAIGGRIRSRSK